MASPAGCSGYRCESPPCTEPCPTSVVPVHRPHLSTAWLPSVHPPGRPGRRGRSARGAAASGLTERSDCRHHASHVATLCHRLVRRRLNTLLPPDLPKSLPQLLTETLSSKDPRSHPSSPIPPSTPPPPARHLSLFELVAEREDGPIESVAWRPRPGSELPNTTCGGSSLHEGSVRRRGGRLRKWGEPSLIWHSLQPGYTAPFRATRLACGHPAPNRQEPRLHPDHLVRDPKVLGHTPRAGETLRQRPPRPPIRRRPPRRPRATRGARSSASRS